MNWSYCKKMAYTEIEPYKAGSRWFSRADHFYVVSRSRGTTLSLRCASDRCPAHWLLKNGQAGPVAGQHDHEPLLWIPNRNAMFHSLKRRSAVESIALNAIYEEEAARYPDAAPHLLFESVAPSMRKWRRSMQPAVPHSLQDYGAALAGHPFHSSRLLATVSASGASAVILVMPGFERCLQESTTIILDGTFLTVPAGLPAYQLLTLHGVIEGCFFHPVLVLMENRRRALYEAVLHRIWRAAGELRPSHIVTDFEPALRTALESVTNTPVQGCLFHFVQALLRRARTEGINVARDSPGWRFVQLYGALAALPSAQVALGLAELPAIAADNGLPFHRGFHDYFISFWMDRVGAEVFSVHNRPHQTSNVAESFHASLRRSLGPAPNIWRFTDVAAEKFAVSASRLEALRAGRLPRRNRQQSYLRATTTHSNLRALERGTITLREFLLATSHHLDVGVGVVVEANHVPDFVDEVEVSAAELPIHMEPALVSPQPLPVQAEPPPPPPLLCGICQENVPIFVLQPCGHLLCSPCLNQIQTCPYCRSPVESTIRFFLP